MRSPQAIRGVASDLLQFDSNIFSSLSRGRSTPPAEWLGVTCVATADGADHDRTDESEWIERMSPSKLVSPTTPSKSPCTALLRRLRSRTDSLGDGSASSPDDGSNITGSTPGKSPMCALLRFVGCAARSPDGVGGGRGRGETEPTESESLIGFSNFLAPDSMLESTFLASSPCGRGDFDSPGLRPHGTPPWKLQERLREKLRERLELVRRPHRSALWHTAAPPIAPSRAAGARTRTASCPRVLPPLRCSAAMWEPRHPPHVPRIG